MAWEENSLSPEELAELKTLLAKEPKARRRLVEAGLLRSVAEARGRTWRALESSGQSSVEERLKTASRFGWIHWRSWMPIAAGVVGGMLCASMAMAYIAAPLARKSVPLFQEGFEAGRQPWTSGFPDRPGVWGGAEGSVVSGNAHAQPLEGQSMARIEPAPESTLSYLERIVDVRPLPAPGQHETRELAVTASFHASEPGLRNRYTLRVAVFGEEPGKIRESWEGREWRQIEGALSMAKRAVSTREDAEGWQTLTAVVEVPRDAQSLVISIASGLFQHPDRKTAHFIDGIEATLSIAPSGLKTPNRIARNLRPLRLPVQTNKPEIE
jgi:hypothetical protein